MTQDSDVWKARHAFWSNMYEELKSYEPTSMTAYGAMYAATLGQIKNILNECERQLNDKET
jgi:hypothetical protein